MEPTLIEIIQCAVIHNLALHLVHFIEIIKQ